MTAVTLVELLTNGASHNGHIHYLQAEGTAKSISYSNLKQRALGLLGHFQDQGVRPGDQMVLLMKENERFIDAFWACIFGGIIPVPLAAGLNQNHKNKILQVCGQLQSPYIYTTKNDRQALIEFAESQSNAALVKLLQDQSLLSELVSADQAVGKPHPSQPTDLAFIQFSSGSTSTPKGVMLSHQNLFANIEAMIEGAQLSVDDKTLGWMPLTHDMGLIGFHLVPLARGIDQYLLPTELFIRRPGSWMNFVNEFRVTVTCSPNFGLKHFLSYNTPEQAQKWDLSCVRLLLNGAEPISAELCRNFLDQMTEFGLNPDVMFPVYGLAEASLAVTFPKPGSPLNTVKVHRDQLNQGQPVTFTEQNHLELVVLGSAVKNCTVTICDEQGAAVDPQTVGRVVISGQNVTKGYYNQPQVTAQSITSAGLDTGDLGFEIDGQLVICGRSKEIIFVNGQNYFPHDLESCLISVPGCELGRAVVTSVKHHRQEQVAAFILHKGEPNEEFIALAAAVKQQLTRTAGVEASHVLPVRQIPKTTSGKIQRFQLAQDFEQGAFDQVLEQLNFLTAQDEAQTSSDQKTENTLLSICQEFLPDKTIGVEDNLFELGTSSLVLTQIHDKIDELWPDRLELTDYFDYPTVRELATFLDGDS